MLSLITYTLYVFFQSELIIHLSTVKGRKHILSDIWMYQEKKYYKSTSKLPYKLRIIPSVDCAIDNPKNNVYES
jgi:hypothetical protein